jgi:Leucine-rich repeat (LRR) protein
VGGIDEENADDDNDSMTNMTVQNSPVDPNNPVSAEVFDEDEENRRIQEKVERERERQRAEQEGEIPEAEIVTEKQNCNTRDKIWSVVAVILLVTVAVVLGTVLPPQIKANSNQTTDPATPSQQEVIQELESLLIPVTFDNGTALRTASSPQNKALIWLSNNTDINSYSNATKIQRYALATLFYCTNGNSWFSKANWSSNRDECDWGYVFCDENRSLETLDLSSNNLFGTIPNELALLSNLNYLDLSSLTGTIPNNLTGTIPSQIALMSNLYGLYLSGNSLTGTIPTEIALMSNLSELSLWGNSLTGTIPSQLGLLTKLNWLLLDSNNLTGTIPSQLGLLTNLTGLVLFSNSLTGTIPSQIALMSNLAGLSLFNNTLTATIPNQIALMSNLTDLYLSYNSLTGTIPSEVGLLTKLTGLDLYSNNFMGEFTCPAFIDDCWISCDYETDTYTQACRSL